MASDAERDAEPTQLVVPMQCASHGVHFREPVVSDVQVFEPAVVALTKSPTSEFHVSPTSATMRALKARLATGMAEPTKPLLTPAADI